MALHMNLKHVFNTDLDTFWDKVFFDEEYNRRLYLEALSFRGYELLELTRHPDGSVTRRVRTTPKEDAPQAVKKFLGTEFSYTESGRWDPGTKRWKYEIQPSQMAQKVRIAGDYWLEPRGEKRAERICTVDLEVRVPILGAVVEKFIEAQTQTSYDITQRFTNQFLADKGLS